MSYYEEYDRKRSEVFHLSVKWILVLIVIGLILAKILS